MPKLVSVKDVAEAVGLHPASVRAKIHAGEWPAYFFGERTIRLDLEEIKRVARRECSESQRREEGARQ